MGLQDLTAQMVEMRKDAKQADIADLLKQVLAQNFKAQQRKDDVEIENTNFMLNQLEVIVNETKGLSDDKKAKYQDMISDSLGENKIHQKLLTKMAKGSMTLMKDMLPSSDHLIGMLSTHSPLLALGLSTIKNITDSVTDMRIDRKSEFEEKMEVLDKDTELQDTEKELQDGQFPGFDGVNDSLEKQLGTLSDHTGLLESISDTTMKQLPLLERLNNSDPQGESDKNAPTITRLDTLNELIQEQTSDSTEYHDQQTAISERQFKLQERERVLNEMKLAEAQRESGSDSSVDLSASAAPIEEQKGGILSSIFDMVMGDGLMASIVAGITGGSIGTMISGALMSGVGVLGTAMSAIGGALATGAGVITSFVSAFAAPIAIIAGIGVMVYKFYKGFTSAADKFGEACTLTDKIASGIGSMIGFLGDIVETVTNFLLSPFDIEFDFADDIDMFVSNISKGLFDILKNPLDALEKVVDFSKDMIGNGIEKIKNIGESLFSPITDMFDIILSQLNMVRDFMIDSAISVVSKIPFIGKKAAENLKAMKSVKPLEIEPSINEKEQTVSRTNTKLNESETKSAKNKYRLTENEVSTNTKLNESETKSANEVSTNTKLNESETKSAQAEYASIKQVQSQGQVSTNEDSKSTLNREINDSTELKQSTQSDNFESSQKESTTSLTSDNSSSSSSMSRESNTSQSDRQSNDTTTDSRQESKHIEKQTSMVSDSRLEAINTSIQANQRDLSSNTTKMLSDNKSSEIESMKKISDSILQSDQRSEAITKSKENSKEFKERSSTLKSIETDSVLEVAAEGDTIENVIAADNIDINELAVNIISNEGGSVGSPGSAGTAGSSQIVGSKPRKSSSSDKTGSKGASVGNKPENESASFVSKTSSHTDDVSTGIDTSEHTSSTATKLLNGNITQNNDTVTTEHDSELIKHIENINTNDNELAIMKNQLINEKTTREKTFNNFVAGPDSKTMINSKIMESEKNIASAKAEKQLASNVVVDNRSNSTQINNNSSSSTPQFNFNTKNPDRNNIRGNFAFAV